MNTLARLHRLAVRPHFHWPVLFLAMLLQRTPLLRVLEAARPCFTSPTGGAWTRAAALSLGSLGAVHSLAGATVLAGSTPSPFAATVGREIPPVVFTVTNTINLGSWRLTGTLPPGLKLGSQAGGEELTGPGVLDATTPGTDDGYGGVSGGNGMTIPVLRGTPTQAGSFTFTLQVFQLGGMGGFTAGPFNYTINVAAAQSTGVAPSFLTQPSAQTVNAGASVTFTSSANGTPAPSYQWRKDGAVISGATSATLTLANVQVSDAGSYSVVATNDTGSATSTVVALVVTPPTASLAITAQPVSQTIANGSTVVFNATATGASSFQWRRNGQNLNGATSATLVLTNVSAANDGSYSVVASNGTASVTSTAAALVVTNEPNLGHLINLSILTSIPVAGANFTLGYVVGGDGTSGAKPLVIRAAGPSLGALGVPGTLDDPKMELFAGSAKTGENDNWGGGSDLVNALAAVGAFAYVAPTSRDAASVASITTRDNSVKVSAAGAGTGTVIAEIYDATPASAFTITTPRLINVSVSKPIDAGATLTAGFVIGGNSARTLLIRAIGPGLAAFGVGGTIPDPKLVLQSGGAKIAENDNWGGETPIANAFTSVGGFGLPASSRDAVLLVTLAPGGYTVDVSGTAGGGTALVEIYEVP